jgi:hypothetical protein
MAKFILDGGIILLGYDQIFYLFRPNHAADHILQLFNF